MSFPKQRVFPPYSLVSIHGSQFKLVSGTPFLYHPRRKLLITGDLHLGESYVKNKLTGGAYSSTAKFLVSQIKVLFSNNIHVNQLLINGDVKHISSTWINQEKDELLSLINELKHVQLVFLEGNHDQYLRDLFHITGLSYHVLPFYILDQTLIMHGHKDINRITTSLSVNELILSHEHPSFELRGTVREKVKLPAFITGFLKTGEHIIILPAGSRSSEGIVIDPLNPRFLSPLLQTNVLVNTLEYYLIDPNVGTMHVPFCY